MDERYEGPTGERSDAFEKAEREDKASGRSEREQTLARMVREAKRYFEEELEADQIEATDYYFGRPFGDEEEGRSKVVATEVRDAVEAVTPSLVRIFMGSDPAIEFAPGRKNNIELARQMTDSCQYEIFERNQGFLNLLGAFDDACIRRIGAVKFWWDESERVEGSEHTGLTMEEVVELTSPDGYGEDAEIEVEELEENGTTFVTGPNGQLQSVPAFDVKIRCVYRHGHVRIEGVPNDEFYYTPARTLRESPVVVHSREVRVSDLVALGFDKKFVISQAGTTAVTSELDEARNWGRIKWPKGDDESKDPSLRPVLYTEVWANLDVDGDGIAERRLFRCVGKEYRIDPDEPDGEVTDGVPFAVFTPRPLPHKIDGMGFHDLLKDIQRIMSQVERGVLDSLALALEQKVFFQDGKVNEGDLIDPDILNFVRTFGDPNQVVRVVTHDFIGPEAIPVLEWYEHKREERTGITKASKGLDADSLQSSTKLAVAGTLEKAQERIELIARAFAETGMRDLYKGVMRLLVKHQDKPFMQRLRGKWVEVDPRHWFADADTVVNVGTGTGSRQERIEALMQVAADHETHMAANSPLVSWKEVRATRARLVELLGLKSADEFYKPWGDEEQAQWEQQQAQAAQQPTDPTQVLAQIEMAKVQLQGQVEQMKLQLQVQKLEMEAMKIQMQDEREREKAAMDAALREYEIELENQADINDAELKAAIARRKADMEIAVKRRATAAAKRSDD